jgi:hypothetical protein
MKIQPKKLLLRPLMIFWIVVLFLFSMWFVLFKWNFVPYPSNSEYPPNICYSPNHEYYIKRYQTPIVALQDQLYAEGIAILYDKTGKEIFRGKTHLAGDAGPLWLSRTVSFQGAKGWYMELPSSVGEHSDRDQGCF